MALALATPVATGVASTLPDSSSTWNLALKHYLAARQRHEAYLAQVLDPVLRSAVAGGPGFSSLVADLEAEGDALCSARHQALALLLHTPATSLADLSLKFRLAYEEYLRFDDGNGCLKSLLVDLERLAALGPA